MDTGSGDNVDDEYWMQQALLQANLAYQNNEVPVGAVVVQNGKLIGSGFNQPICSSDATAHAEICALRAASKTIDNYRLTDCTLYVSIEPCTMCFGAIVHARISRLVYGAEEPRAGVVSSNLRLAEAKHYNHRVDVLSGVLAEESRALMQRFFAERRQLAESRTKR